MSKNLCSIKKCKKKLVDGRGLFKIPQKGARRELWLKFMKEEGVNVLKRKDLHLCGLHFRSEDILFGEKRIHLSPEAVLSIRTVDVNLEIIVDQDQSPSQDQNVNIDQLLYCNQDFIQEINQDNQENIASELLFSSSSQDGNLSETLERPIESFDPYLMISSLTSKLVESEQKNDELKMMLENETIIANQWRSMYENCQTELTTLQDSLKSRFHDDQLKIISGKSHVHWSDEMIAESLAVKLRCGNNGLAHVVKNCAPLPSGRTVRRRLESIKFSPGIQLLNLKMMKLKCDLLPAHQKNFQIVFDEKSITPGSYYDRSTKTHLGVSTIQPTDAHLKNNPDAVATHVLVFQLVGLTTRYKEIASIEYTAGATNGLALWECLMNVIKACEDIVGVNIVSIAMDMNNDNIAMLNAAGVSITSTTQTHTFTHPFDDTRIIFVKPDDIHNIKNMICGFRVKNIVLDDSLVSQFNLTSSVASFSEVLKIYDKQKGATYKLCPKLTQKVVYPTHFDKMRESINDEIFSPEVIAAIESENESEKLNTTAFVLKQFYTFHRITTSKEWSIDNIGKYEEDIKALKSIQDFFMKIKFVDGAGKTTFKRSLYAAIVSVKTLIDLSKFLFDCGSPTVVPAYMLSNSIENLFSLAVAHNKKQNAVQMKDTFKSITLSNHQEELLDFQGSYKLERNQNDNEKISFLKMIMDESQKENEEKLRINNQDTLEQTSFFHIPAVIDPLKVFKNELEVKGFEQASEKFIRENCKGVCQVCFEMMIGPDNKLSNQGKTCLLQLEYAFRIVQKRISSTSDTFANIFIEYASFFNFTLHCQLFTSYLHNSFLRHRHNQQQKNLKVPEASRLASRSQV